MNSTTESAVAELTEYLVRLSLRYARAFDRAYPIGEFAEGRHERLARQLMESARNGDAVALARITATVGDAVAPVNEHFWTGPLGIVMFALGAWPAPWVSQSLASRVMRCSRQYIHELVRDGKLEADSSRMVSTAQVAARVAATLDNEVK